MQRITNIRDLAKRVGLSTCTVSKVLSDAEHKLKITDAVRQRVEEAARKFLLDLLSRLNRKDNKAEENN